MKKQLIEFYTDWVNHFLTVERLADYYDIEVDDALELISIGKKYHEQNVELYKIGAK